MFTSIFLRRWVIAVLALFMTMTDFAAAAIINIQTSQWGVRSADGLYDSDNKTNASSWLVGNIGSTGGTTPTGIRSYWGFDIPDLGTINSVTLVAYSADVNMQDGLGKSVFFRGPDTSIHSGTSFTYANLAGPAIYTLFTSEFYDWTDTGQTRNLSFNTLYLDRVTQGGTFWLSGLTTVGVTSTSEHLVFSGSAGGDSLTPGDDFYLSIDYTPSGGGPVPEPATFGLIALGMLFAFFVTAERTYSSH